VGSNTGAERAVVVVPPYGIRVDEPDGAGVVTLFGEHDAFGAEGLRSELERLLAAGTPVVVDLSEATFIDSSTVSVLLSAFREGAEAGLSLDLVLPQAPTAPHVRRLLELTRLDSVFPIHESLAAALEVAHQRHH
jgi:anti-sigma B factor antagonist